MSETPKTLMDAVKYFADLTACEDYMRSIRWPKGEPVCPACASKRIGEVASRRMMQCKDCRKQFSHKVGTIFEDSPLGLDKWFVAVWCIAVWCIANCKNGISSHELARAIGVNQKSAWFMLHRIRAAMESEDASKFDGPVEADTTYVAEQTERFNNRAASDGDRFRAVLSRVFGRRLTWRVLTGVDGAGFMTLT